MIKLFVKSLILFKRVVLIIETGGMLIMEIPVGVDWRSSTKITMASFSLSFEKHMFQASNLLSLRSRTVKTFPCLLGETLCVIM